MRRLRLSLLVLSLAVGACDLVAPESSTVRSVTVTAVHPLVFRLDITLDRPGAVVVEYESAGVPLMVESPDSRLVHSVLMTRLTANATIGIEVMATGGTWRGSATTGALPAEVGGIGVEGGNALVGSLTLFEVNDPQGFRGAIVLNHKSEVVWFYETEGALTGSTVLPNGNYVFVDLAQGLVEVAPDGEVVRRIPHPEGRTIHHDVIQDREGGLLYLVTDPRTWNGRTIVGDAIWRWTEGGGATRVWSALDHLDPDLDWAIRSRDSDWLHANSLSLGPRGNLVMSLNHLNQIVSIRSDFASLEWRLGGPGATIEVPPEGRFSGQHTATELADGRILMFDNGIEREAPFSRALELRIQDGHAAVVRDLRPSPANWSRAISSAFRTPDGNTYITYGLPAGLAGSTGPIESYIVGPSGETLGALRFTGGVGSVYRGSRLESVGGERVVK